MRVSEQRARSDTEHEALLRLAALERVSSAEEAAEEASEARASSELEADSLRAQVGREGMWLVVVVECLDGLVYTGPRIVCVLLCRVYTRCSLYIVRRKVEITKFMSMMGAPAATNYFEDADTVVGWRSEQHSIGLLICLFC